MILFIEYFFSLWYNIYTKGIDIMNLEDEFKYLVGGYFGVREMDNYDLKVYVLEDIENYIRDYIANNPIDNFNYKEEANKICDEMSIKTKLQDSLLVLNKINAPMELVFLIKARLEEMKKIE